MEQTWPLVGRDRERAAIDRAFARPVIGGVVLVGDPGVGLTRLGREAVRALGTPDRHVDWVAALLAPATAPFGAVAHLVPAETRPDAPPIDVIRATAGRFAALGGRANTVIGVDDAHRLDPLSAALLAQLAARSLAFVVVTTRRGQPVPEPIGSLCKDGVAQRIDVAPLPPGEFDILLGHALPGPVDAITRHRLHRAALGRPAILREVLADGTWSQRHRVWRWQPPAAAGHRAAGSAATRLSDCDSGVRAVLEVVAYGEPVPLEVLERLTDGPAIEAAERTGRVVVERSGARTQARLAVPGGADAIRAGMPFVRARWIAARLGEELVATPLRRADDLTRLAAWQRASGTVVAAQMLVPAARQLSGDPSLAEWCARTAMAAGDAEAPLLLAQLLTAQGRSDETAALLAGSAPTPPHRAAWAAAQAAVYYWSAGRLDRAGETVDRAAAELGRDLTDALRAWILLFGGDCVAALAAATDILARPSCGDLAIVWAAVAGSGAAGLIGAPGESLRLRALGVAAAEGRPDLAAARPYLDCVACAALLASGDLDRAATIAGRGYAAAAAGEVPLLLGVWALLRGMLARAAGRVVTAQALLREALSLFGDTGTRLLALCRAELAGAAALTGDLAAASEWLVSAPASGPAIHPWTERAAAWVLAARGSTTDAVARLRAVAATAAPMAEVHLLYDAARLGAAAQVTARLTELGQRIGGRLVPTLAVAAAGFAAGTGADARTAAALAAAGTTLAELGYLLLAAEASLAAARAYRRLGRRSPALVCREVAVDLIGRCEGARTPLLGFGDVEAALTTREREILLLAASQTSRQIAGRLGVAVSTVNNHLARAYAKLGIAGRDELGELLGRTAPL